MILRPVRPVSPCGPPTTKRPVGLIRNSVALVEHLRRQDLANHFLDAELLDVLVGGVGRVLRGDDDVGDRDRPAVFVDHRHLRLGVRAQPRHLALLANLGQLPAEAVGEHDRRGHQLRRLVAGVAEHQALVTGTLLGGLLARGLLGVDALGDVGRLLRDQHVHEHPVGMEHVVVVDVADLADAVARDLDEIELGLGGDLAADDHHVRLHVGFAGDAAELVLCEARIEDRVGNRVGDFVGVTFADGFRREDVSVAHSDSKKKARLSRAWLAT